MEKAFKGLLASVILMNLYTPRADGRVEWPQLVSVEWVLDTESHEDHQLLKSIYSKVISVGMGSGTLAEQAEPGSLLLYSAGHNFGSNRMGVLGLPDKSDFGVIYKGNPQEPVVLLGKTIFRKESQNISKPNEQMLPENDFMLGLVEQSTVKISSESKANNIWKAGDPIFILGYPAKGHGHLYYSVGKIATSEQINSITKTSPISLDLNVEYIVMASSMAGMSGGGAFDQFGNFIGVVVRSGIDAGGNSYTRIVRKDYINNELSKRLLLLPVVEFEEISKKLPSHFSVRLCADIFR